MSTTNRTMPLYSMESEDFSGSGALSEPEPPTLRFGERAPDLAPDERRAEEEEPIPETLRSSVSTRLREPVSRPIVIEEVDYHAA